MTGEEARNLLNNSKPKDNNAYSIMLNEALDMAINALEQEPCKDTISRQAVINVFPRWKFVSYEAYIRSVAELENLPPVTPQPKIGRWIMKHRTYNEIKHYTGQDEMGEIHTISVLERYETDEPYCSECGKRAGDTSQDYCCACGVKMEEGEQNE